MQVGITTMIEWPTSDTWVEYSGTKFLLRCSKFKFHGPDILCEYSEPSNINAYRSIFEFMSVLAWLKGQAIEERIHGSTSSTNMPTMTGPATFTQNITENLQLKIFPDMSHPKAGLGLALYREALCTRSIPLKFLGFWKLVSLIQKDGEPEQKELLLRTIPKLVNSSAVNRIEELFASTTNKADLEMVQKHLYKSRRCAIAHATFEDVINPDDPVALITEDQRNKVIEIFNNASASHPPERMLKAADRILALAKQQGWSSSAVERLAQLRSSYCQLEGEAN